MKFDFGILPILGKRELSLLCSAEKFSKCRVTAELYTHVVTKKVDELRSRESLSVALGWEIELRIADERSLIFLFRGLMAMANPP
jgi:hypothetical protein